APLIRTSSLPAFGRSVPIMASTANVPLPWTGTHVWESPPLASSTSRSRTRRLMAMNAASREPQSRVIAALTVAEVVRGPGVSSQGSRAESTIGQPFGPAVAEDHRTGEHGPTSPAVLHRGSETEHGVDEGEETGNKGGHGRRPRKKAVA